MVRTKGQGGDPRKARSKAGKKADNARNKASVLSWLAVAPECVKSSLGSLGDERDWTGFKALIRSAFSSDADDVSLNFLDNSQHCVDIHSKLPHLAEHLECAAAFAEHQVDEAEKQAQKLEAKADKCAIVEWLAQKVELRRELKSLHESLRRAEFAETFAERVRQAWDLEDRAPLHVLSDINHIKDMYNKGCLGLLSKAQFISLNKGAKRKHLDNFPEYNPKKGRLEPGTDHRLEPCTDQRPDPALSSTGQSLEPTEPSTEHNGSAEVADDGPPDNNAGDH